MITREFLKASGLMIRERVEDMRGTKMGIAMKASFLIIKPMEEESINGKREKFMTGNGLMERRKAMEYGEACMATATLESGKILKQRDTEFMSGRTVISMKESGVIS